MVLSTYIALQGNNMLWDMKF